MIDDLTEDAVAAALPGRPVRIYPAVVTTEADALAWAHRGAPPGALVVAGYQVSPRNRAGFLWGTTPDVGIGFSLVLRPALSIHREGWLFTVATTAIAEVAGGDARFLWPDVVLRDGERWAMATVRTEEEEHELAAAVVSVLVPGAEPPRIGLLAELVTAIEERLEADDEETLAEAVERCATLGRSVTARLVPLGPTGERVTGLAVDLKQDGALVLRTREERRLAVRPHAVGILEEAL